MKTVNECVDVIFKGDSIEFLKKNIVDDTFDFVLTSPPYNQNTSVSAKKKLYSEYKDNLHMDEYEKFICDIIEQLLRVTKKHIFFNIMYGSDNKLALFNMIGKYSRNIKDVLIWKKPIQPAVRRNVLTHNYEYVFVLEKNSTNRTYDIDFGLQGEHVTCFDEKTNNCMNPDSFHCEENLAIMPINLANRIITTFTSEGDLILDPFSGTGTTLVSAKRHGRKYCGIDMSDKMIEVAQSRLYNTKIMSKNIYFE